MMTTILVAFLFGLFGSIHCIAMCGGFACLGQACPKSTGMRKASVLVSFNAGRITTYICIALLISVFVNQTALLLEVPYWTHILRLVFALSLITAGLHIFGNVSLLKPIENIGQKAFTKLIPFAKNLLPIKHAKHAFILGLFWGSLPCGLLYAALLMAISHNDAILAGLTMLGFGLGTLPAMIGMGLFGASLKQWIQKRTLRKMAGGLMVIVGLGTATLPAYAIVKSAVMSDVETTGLDSHVTAPSCH